MVNLEEQIRADARERLVLPPGRRPVEELDRYRKYLEFENHRLKLAHRDGRSGLAICRARALALDCLLQHLMAAAQSFHAATADTSAARTALVAVGGYGRAEMCPHSDLDLLFLHDLPHTPVKADRFGAKGLPFLGLFDGTTLLFDLFPKLGYSVRTVAECVEWANQDLRTKTALIESRLVWGDPGLYEKLQQAVQARCIRGREEAYIRERLADQAARREKYGNTPCLQEPHVKNGCGGLRDYQNLIWMAHFRFGCRTMAELAERGLVTETERQELERAYDFLLRTRNELHFHTGRAEDVLKRALQPAVARNLGYLDRSLARRIERFMSEYLRHARTIYLLTRTVEQRLAWIPQPRRLPTLRQFLHQRRRRKGRVVDGFKFVDGQVFPAHGGIFVEEPARLMRVFQQNQLRGTSLSAEMAALIRQSLSLVTPRFRADPHVHETFLEILRHRGAVAPVLREMHEVGLLGAFIPPFGRMTMRVQHEFFHIYTADEHTLVGIEKLDALWTTADESLGFYREVFQEVERPELLYLALLLHDAGRTQKARRHAERGARIAASVARRLGLSEADVATVAWLVRHHGVLTQAGLRLDLSDPVQVHRLAEQIGHEENLRMLTLLTVADTRATSRTLWNGFKDSALRHVFAVVWASLKGGHTERAEERREQLKRDVRHFLTARIDQEEIDAHFRNLPEHYFACREAREIAADIELMHDFMLAQLDSETRALEPVVSWHELPDRGCSQVKVCAWDHPGALSRIAAALTMAGINILSARVFTRAEGVLLDSFLVLDADTGEPVRPRVQERCTHLLREILGERQDPFDCLRRCRQRLANAPKISDQAWLPVEIHFDNETVPGRTLLEIQAADRVGLLCALLTVLAEEGINIDLARISTELGAAIDVFHVRDARGNPITDPARQAHLRARLRAAIEGMAAVPAAAAAAG